MLDKSAVVIRRLTLSDEPYFAAGLELLNSTQGRDLCGPQFFHNHVSDPLSYVVGAFYNYKLIGVGTAKIIDNVDYYLPFDAHLPQELPHNKIGSFATLSVEPQFQGQGVGQMIGRERLRWLNEQKCDFILGVSWVSKLKHTSDRAFEKLGFRKVDIAFDFYRDFSLKNPFLCPQCGKPPCQCDAILYRLDLNPEAVVNKLIRSLQAAYSGELAAYHAYEGHWRSVRDKKEKEDIQRIQKEEWDHRVCIGDFLAKLNAKPNPQLEKKFSFIGKLISFLCYIGGWFIPMYGAGKLEASNIVEYEDAARLAFQNKLPEMAKVLLHMAEIEWEHELYFRLKAQSHWLWAFFPHWPVPSPRESIAQKFEVEKHAPPPL